MKQNWNKIPNTELGASVWPTSEVFELTDDCGEYIRIEFDDIPGLIAWLETLRPEDEKI